MLWPLVIPPPPVGWVGLGCQFFLGGIHPRPANKQHWFLRSNFKTSLPIYNNNDGGEPFPLNFSISNEKRKFNFKAPRNFQTLVHKTS